MRTPSPKRRRVSQEVREGLAVAQTLRDELGLRDDEPVSCIVEIAEERLGLDVVIAPLRDAVSGFYLPVPPRGVIVVSNEHPVSRQRFTVAHEIAHCAMGHGASPRIMEASRSPDAPPSQPAVVASAAVAPDSHYTPQKSSDPNERAANAFAGELLVPSAGAALVAADWAGQAPLDQVVRLSSHFGISAFAATVKFQMLDLFDADTLAAVRSQLRTLDHITRYDELDLPALDDALHRHRVSGARVRCSPRARTVLATLRGEADAL